MARIVATSLDFGDADFERKLVEAAGIEFVAYDEPGDRDPARIVELLRGADGAITSYGDYDARVFGELPGLRVVAKTGTGYDNIDVAAATANGTAVCNVVGYGTEVVSDHAIALALAVLRRIPQIDADMREGIWDFARRRPLGQVHGRTFGVVGMGHIGRAVARKARGLGFRVIVWDRELAVGGLTPEAFEAVALEELLSRADVVSFHTALAPDTRHLLNEGNIGLLKRDAVVVNTSRGAVIDTQALARALESGALWGAGLDVFEEEPLPADAPIRHAPRTVLTSHAAYWSEESAVELRTRCANDAIAVVLGRPPENCVNPDALPRALAKGGAQA